MVNEKTYYEILGVLNNAEPEVIKGAYRSLSQKYHPDSSGSNKDSSEKMKEINVAYGVVSDIEKREHYDFYLEAFDTSEISFQDYLESLDEINEDEQNGSQSKSPVSPLAKKSSKEKKKKTVSKRQGKEETFTDGSPVSSYEKDYPEESEEKHQNDPSSSGLSSTWPFSDGEGKAGKDGSGPELNMGAIIAVFLLITFVVGVGFLFGS